MVWMGSNSGCLARVAAMAVVMGTLCTLVGAGGAWAGEYHVYSCRMPDGQVAPTDGWSKTVLGSAVYAEDKCEKNGALMAALDAGVVHPVGTDTATWTFSAPVGETVSKATLWRAGDAEGGAVANATYEFWLAGPTQPEAFDSCVYVSGCMKTVGEPETPLSVLNLMAVPASSLGEHLYVNASCGGLQTYKCPSGKGDVSGYAAVVYLYAADLTLEQTSQPTVSHVEGELATAATLSGTVDLSFHAEDPGSGVYQAVFTVDGVEVGHTVLEEDNGRCHNVGQSTDGLPAFLYLQPCPASVSADLPFDTTTLGDGTHHLLVTVTNAAGNSVVVLDRKITVLNHPPVPTPPSQPSPEGQEPASTTTNDPSSPSQNPTPAPSSVPTTQPQSNGTNATATAMLRVHWSATASTSLAGTFNRAQIVLGQLTAPDGTPIVGALIHVLDTPAYENAPTHALATVRTGANGSFRVHVPAGAPSSRLTFAYSSQPTQAVPDVTAALQLVVPASLTLNVTPHDSHIGGTIIFTGMLHGAPLPPGGKQLVLEARTLTGPWRQFQVLATGSHGRYRASYRFRLAGPIAYQFRAVSSQEADFPYATGSSNVVLVHER